MTTINKKVLIVEDDEDFLFILQKKFTMEGFTIIVAKDGQEGIAVVKKEKPDIIFSDVLMPKVDGIAMVKMLRQAKIDTPIVFLTNIQDVDYTKDAQKSDNVEYLIKSNTRIDEIVAKAKEKLGV